MAFRDDGMRADELKVICVIGACKEARKTENLPDPVETICYTSFNFICIKGKRLP